MQLLSGKTLRDLIADRLKQEIQELGFKPKLVIMQIGDLSESNAFVHQKKLFAEKIGAEIEHKRYPFTVNEDTLLADIEHFNKDKGIHGVILQLPIPAGLNKDKIIDAINPTKDVDGLSATNEKKLWIKEKGMIPATARGIVSLLRHYDIDLDGKKVVIVGRSVLVGKPIALLMLQENATVTITHRHTVDLAKETKEADVLIVAAGSPKLITKKHVKAGQTVVDVGITVVDGKMTGDVDFEAVKDTVGAISPVPGGVGPMTVASLFENLVESTLSTKN